MRLALPVVCGLLTACTPKAAPSPAIEASPSVVPGSADASAPSPRAVAAASASEDAEDAAAPATPAQPTWRGDFCRADADCGWDDPCGPRRCAAVKAPSVVDCAEKSPFPGSCACVEGQCTLRPTIPSQAAGPQDACGGETKCAIDVATGTCHAGGDWRIGPIEIEGPVCLCGERTQVCELKWSGPVPCESWRDCSWVREPRLRAVPSREVPRPVARPVKPCRDGEVDAVCEPVGDRKYCRIRGWKC